MNGLYSAARQFRMREIGPQLLSAFNRYYYGKNYSAAAATEGRAPLISAVAATAAVAGTFAVAMLVVCSRGSRGPAAVAGAREGAMGSMNSGHAASRIALNSVLMFVVVVSATVRMGAGISACVCVCVCVCA